MSKLGSLYLGSAMALSGALLVSSTANAAVEKQGEWPADEKKVTLDASRVTREDAIKRLAEAAGWSIVVHAPSADPVDIRVKDQPADKVLALLLSDGQYVATRDGTLISISRGSKSAEATTEVAKGSPAIPPVPAVPPVPPVPPIPALPGAATIAQPASPGDANNKVPAVAEPAKPTPKKGDGKDREVVGNALTIEKDEVVKDVHLIGGPLEIKGVVTGDVEVVGGRVEIMPGGHVMGDAQVMGGSLTVKNGAMLDGDARIVGGTLEREEGAIVGGDVSTRISADNDDDEEKASFGTRLARDMGEAMTGGALLFALGAALIALFTRRSETLKVEIAARPMRSLALGFVGILASIVVIVALCVTVVGIPVAVVGILAAVFGVFGAMCSVLEVIGRALVGHKTKNEYAHLALGCALFVVTTAIPVVGGIFKAAVVLTAIGSLFATRAAGLIPPRKGSAPPVDTTHPYRSAEVV